MNGLSRSKSEGRVGVSLRIFRLFCRHDDRKIDDEWEGWCDAGLEEKGREPTRMENLLSSLSMVLETVQNANGQHSTGATSVP